jgi:hypothetical protein
VQDARGQEFPPGDFVQDVQVQEGIRQVLSQLGTSPSEIDDYSAVIRAPLDTDRPLVAGTPAGSERVDSEMAAALAALEGELSADDLAKVRAVLSETLR